MTVVSVLMGMTLLFLVASFMLNWVADLRRFRGATSAHESRQKNDRLRDADLFERRQARAAAFRDRMQRERARRQQEGEARPDDTPRPPRPPPPAAHSAELRHRATLELGPGPISPEALRRQYRMLMAAYHPDRVSSLGRKLQVLAEEESKAINEAHAYFKARMPAEQRPDAARRAEP